MSTFPGGEGTAIKRGQQVKGIINNSLTFQKPAFNVVL
jgi:hypothetical protein